MAVSSTEARRSLISALAASASAMASATLARVDQPLYPEVALSISGQAG